MYEISDAEGTCEMPCCNWPASVSLSGLNLCFSHYAEEVGLTEPEAVAYIHSLGIALPPKSKPPLGKATDVAELGM